MLPKNNKSIINTYHLVFQALRSQPKLLIPFGIFALVELVFLVLIYVAPRQPLNVVLAPPIRAFWGERFLHYPANFLLLPKLSALIRNFLSCTIGSFLTGLAVLMAADAYNKKAINMFSSVKASFKKYLPLFTIVLIINLLFFSLLKLVEAGLIKYFTSGHATLLSLKPQIWLGPVSIVINLLIVLLVQGLFVYSIPLLMIGNEKLFKAIGKSTVLFFKLFAPTTVLIGLPLLTIVPIIALQFNTPVLIDKVFPEAVLFVCIAGVIINSLVLDLLITISTTILYLQNKD
jgi:preprotein translocase subunit Sec61beta